MGPTRIVVVVSSISNVDIETVGWSDGVTSADLSRHQYAGHYHGKKNARFSEFFRYIGPSRTTVLSILSLAIWTSQPMARVTPPVCGPLLPQEGSVFLRLFRTKWPSPNDCFVCIKCPNDCFVYIKCGHPDGLLSADLPHHQYAVYDHDTKGAYFCVYLEPIGSARDLR